MMRELVTVDSICERYKCERHKAASILYRLPNFKVGNRLFAYQSDLEDWERKQIEYPTVREVRPRRKSDCLFPRWKDA